MWEVQLDRFPQSKGLNEVKNQVSWRFNSIIQTTASWWSEDLWIAWRENVLAEFTSFAIKKEAKTDGKLVRWHIIKRWSQWSWVGPATSIQMLKFRSCFIKPASLVRPYDE